MHSSRSLRSLQLRFLGKLEVSSEISTKERPASKITWILAKFSSLQPVGLRVSDPGRLSASDHPQFPYNCWLSAYLLSHSQQRWESTERICQQHRSHKGIANISLHIFCILSVRNTPQFSPHSRGEAYTKAYILGGETIGGHLSTTLIFNFFFE